MNLELWLAVLIFVHLVQRVHIWIDSARLRYAAEELRIKLIWKHEMRK